ncbi:hypothetical protein HDU91_002432 [Kappamyces sp. JEL0680]|nr:hypothetical protein HDU91_002432 [Kappamyces sp. JEL0680]
MGNSASRKVDPQSPGTAGPAPPPSPWKTKFNDFSAKAKATGVVAQFEIERRAAEAKQFAKEKSSAKDLETTAKSAEYAHLEQKCDEMRKVMEILSAVTKNYTIPANDFKAGSWTAGIAGAPAPLSLYHAFNQAGMETTTFKTLDEPSKTALALYATTAGALGDAKCEMDQTVAHKIHERLLAFLNGPDMQEALKCRKAVDAARFQLDVCKLRLKECRREDFKAKIALETQTALDTFTALTKDATAKLALLTGTSMLSATLHDLVLAQWEFHRRACEYLEKVSPQVQKLAAEHASEYSRPQTELQMQPVST